MGRQMSLLQELRQGHFWLVRHRFDDYGSFDTYDTESGHIIVISESPFGYNIWVNNKAVNWVYGWMIRRAIKRGLKTHDQI